MIEEFNLKPILAVVPDNRDRELMRSDPDPTFWQRMRTLEASGASIALHGYQHLCGNKGKSLVPLHRHSEFAGVPLDLQRQWISAGLDILRGNGLNPRVWVAPRHGFDANTLLALREERIGLLSDGLARAPFLRQGLVWIPQQLWSPVDKRSGLWTVCIHSNTANRPQADKLRAFVSSHAAQFTSVDRIVEEFKPGPLSPRERIYELFAGWRIRTSRTKKRLRRKSK